MVSPTATEDYVTSAVSQAVSESLLAYCPSGIFLEIGGHNTNGTKCLDKGDTAWMLVATAFVLMMTVPGLGLFYGGMVREKNVLSVLMQMFSITALISFLWLCFGYSLAFGPASGKDVDWPYHKNKIIGDSSRFWFNGMNSNSAHVLAPSVPETVFCTYQLTFAIITCALISGSFADRMKFGSMLVFMGLWHILVYCPIAHWNWHPNGFLNMAGVMDFAGGNVVHISSGIAGLMSSIVVGNRNGFGVDKFPPHNILYSMTGAALLWVGWFGFNAGINSISVIPPNKAL